MNNLSTRISNKFHAVYIPGTRPSGLLYSEVWTGRLGALAVETTCQELTSRFSRFNGRVRVQHTTEADGAPATRFIVEN